uniref:Activator of basal transcription 1 n=1 Tax=Malurus cyaneus samueli TaxID=2593467 RepID=A0A8C5X3J6_9PASS
SSGRMARAAGPAQEGEEEEEETGEEEEEEREEEQEGMREEDRKNRVKRKNKRIEEEGRERLLPFSHRAPSPLPAGGSVRRRRQRPGGPPAVAFAEGWVEFRDKRAAKRAAKILHGAPMAPRPRSPFRHHCWSIKYLPGFRWPHLSERLSYERQVRAQRLGRGGRQALRGVSTPPVPKPKRPPKSSRDPDAPLPTWGFTQRPTEEEIWKRKAQPPPAAPPRRLLEKVFGGGR